MLVGLPARPWPGCQDPARGAGARAAGRPRGQDKRKRGGALGGGFEKECVELLFPGFEEVEEGGSHDEGTPSRYVTVFGDYLLNLTRQFEETDFGNLEGGEVTGASNEIVEEFMDKEEVRSWK